MFVYISFPFPLLLEEHFIFENPLASPSWVSDLVSLTLTPLHSTYVLSVEASDPSSFVLWGDQRHPLYLVREDTVLLGGVYLHYFFPEMLPQWKG